MLDSPFPALAPLVREWAVSTRKRLAKTPSLQKRLSPEKHKTATRARRSGGETRANPSQMEMEGVMTIRMMKRPILSPLVMLKIFTNLAKK